jgi:hypothetical protein
MHELLLNLPNELITIIIGFHPYFFKYDRDYNKINIYNSIPQPHIPISFKDYISVKNKYFNTDISITIEKNKIIHTILLFFEVNNGLDYIF